MKIHNLGIIGAGMYGKMLMRCFQQDARAHILWVNSAGETTTRSAAEAFKISKWDDVYPEKGKICGKAVGECKPGTYNCIAGALVCQGETAGTAELCDGKDNDCNGAIDDNVTDGNKPCWPGGYVLPPCTATSCPCPATATSCGECKQGATKCVGAKFECHGGTAPTGEICDGKDNDCDGATDDVYPEKGKTCGSNVGECTQGIWACVGGKLECQGGALPTPELSDMTIKWSPALKAFFLGLARNGLSSHPNSVPISGFIAFLRFYTLMRRDAWMFSYLPEDGGTSVCEPLSARVTQLGGRVRLGSRVTRVVPPKSGGIITNQGESWLVVWETAEGEESALAGEIILATDPNNAKKILGASFGESVDDLFFPRALSNAVVRLWFDAKPRKNPEAGIFTGNFTVHNYFWLDRLCDPYRRWARETGGNTCSRITYFRYNHQSRGILRDSSSTSCTSRPGSASWLPRGYG